MYFYSDEKIAGFKGGKIPDFDPNVMFAFHFGNMLHLEFYEKAETGIKALWDIRKEKEICQRKLDYWKKKKDWDAKISGDLCEKHKKMWRDIPQAKLNKAVK